ncbi:dienelactone hydrolase family protein [Cupriavidus sp. D39]|uniref:dienelactone hydrolase family protein n=1 Tax=Cupriavidus sp. D39 TaxID=2997877 RepID=UPI00226EB1B3|nr:dienelactone hydrolase family protein [Cupriavidus sp. D39]MCY0853606.1 dienelactone hydrolase family protein [Cupriavidus sp. D39]
MRCLLKISLLRQVFAIGLAAAVALPVLSHEIYNNLASGPSGKIYFNSVTPKSKWELVHRKYDRKPTTVWGMLYMPESVEGRVPAMVISHGSAGVQEKDIDRWVRAFNKMGIAAFVVDSFGGRGITGTMNDQSQLSPAANDADALFALKLLSTDPRIDPRRIGQIGFSRGGHVAMDLVLESFHKGVIDDDTRFVALIGFYPGCTQLWWEVPPPPLTGAPLMLAVGEKDDYTPAQPCLNVADTMKRDGQSVEVHMYPGAYHDFDNTHVYFKYFPGATTLRDCPQAILDVRHDAYYRLLTGEKYASFQAMDAEYRRCIARGVSAGSSLDQGRKSEADVKAFLTRAMGL